MNYIFIFLLLFSFVCAVLTGRLELVVNAMFDACKKSVEVAFSMIGIMAFWLGIVNIAKDSGLVNKFSKIIKKPLLLIFPQLKNNDSAISNIALNISANALGLMNAATPFGINAMKEMQKDNPDKTVVTNSMCTFLAMNTAGFQIVPAAVLAVMSANGMDNPSQLILPTLIVTGLTFISAVFYVKVLERVYK